MRTRRHFRVILLALFVPSCTFAGPETNFSQYPGFSSYFERNPPAKSPPDAKGRALLLRHRPRYLLPREHPGFIDFYRDYIAHGRLYDGEGKLVSDAVTPELLQRHRQDPRAEFQHKPPEGNQDQAVIYGRLDCATLKDPAGQTGRDEALVFLTYHAVFRHSGLPQGLSGWKAALAEFAGDLDDWHQLDHYTAASVVLDAGGRPVAVMLQQHNYVRTYLVGEGIDVPADGRVSLDVALRSNELYPYRHGRNVRRAVPFANRDGMAFLMGFGKRPLIAADDVTHSFRELEYELRFLPAADAFYTFEGFLGERRLLPGRSGPPGARYNTLPELKPLDVQLLSGYWREENSGDFERYRQSEAGGDVAFAGVQAPIFLHNLRCIRNYRLACSLR